MYIVQLRGTWPTPTQNLFTLFAFCAGKKKARVKARVLSTLLLLLFNAVGLLCSW